MGAAGSRCSRDVIGNLPPPRLASASLRVALTRGQASPQQDGQLRLGEPARAAKAPVPAAPAKFPRLVPLNLSPVPVPEPVPEGRGMECRDHLGLHLELGVKSILGHRSTLRNKTMVCKSTGARKEKQETEGCGITHGRGLKQDARARKSWCPL